MKIAICVTGESRNAAISADFTGADYFLIIDTLHPSMQQRINNSHSGIPAAAEIFCPQLLLSKGIDKIICGKCAPDAKRIFSEAKVEVVENAAGSVTDHLN